MPANPFGDATVGALLDAVAARWPEREAIVFGDERVTFRELRDRSIVLARGLHALLPRTPGPHGDKVQRGRLREQAMDELGLQESRP